jgi:hypothetical protein
VAPQIAESSPFAPRKGLSAFAPQKLPFAERKATIRVLSRDDPREIVRRSVVSLSNNQQRMNYPEYRRQGLLLTSALMESLVKDMNWRVKGTEMFWNNPSGAETILALRSATPSEDSRLADTLP